MQAANHSASVFNAVKEYETTVVLVVRYAATDRREAQARTAKIHDAVSRVVPVAESRFGMILTGEIAKPRLVDDGRRAVA